MAPKGACSKLTVHHHHHNNTWVRGEPQIPSQGAGGIGILRKREKGSGTKERAKWNLAEKEKPKKDGHKGGKGQREGCRRN